MLNRKIYKENDDTWLRNQKTKENLSMLSPGEKELLAKFNKYGVKYVYPEDLFYKTHKISRQDFISKLESLEGKKDE